MIAAIIPARMGSSRFPGKPLIKFYGLPMIEHVRRRAVMSGAFGEVVVATCDPEIADAVTSYGGIVVMTADTHQAATDRVAEAMQRVASAHIVNVQGDEILVLPEDLKRMTTAVRLNPDVPAWNAIASISNSEELEDQSIVKCVVSQSNRIMACARDLSRMKSAPGFEPARKILGIVAFERTFLARYSALRRTPLETAESIDQSRILENDFALYGVPFQQGYIGINEPHEVEIVERCLREDPMQRKILAELIG